MMYDGQPESIVYDVIHILDISMMEMGRGEQQVTIGDPAPGPGP